jgi:hypothetical protein
MVTKNLASSGNGGICYFLPSIILIEKRTMKKKDFGTCSLRKKLNSDCEKSYTFYMLFQVLSYELSLKTSKSRKMM